MSRCRGPKVKSRIDSDARNLGKYLAIEVSVLRRTVRSWAGIEGAQAGCLCVGAPDGYRLKDVAGYLGRDAATIATMLSRMNERLAGDI